MEKLKKAHFSDPEFHQKNTQWLDVAWSRTTAPFKTLSPLLSVGVCYGLPLLVSIYFYFSFTYFLLLDMIEETVLKVKAD